MHVCKELQSVGTCKGTNIYVSSHKAGSYIKASVIWSIYIHILVSMCMYTKRFKVGAFARAQTSVRVHSTGRYTNISVIWFLIYVYLWAYDMYVCKEVLTVSTRKGIELCEFAQHGVIHTSIRNMKFVNLWVYLCIQRGSNCEHSQGHRHMWVRTTRSHTQKYL